MAAMIAPRRMPLSKLLEKLAFSPLRPPAAATAPSTRFFNTNTQLRDYADDRLDSVDRRGADSAASRRFPSVFAADVWDPFNPTRSLSQVLNLMDKMLENPFAGAAGGLRRGWDAKEDDDALYLRVDMPGLGKEHVKVWAEQNTLIIKGEGNGDGEGEGEGEGEKASEDGGSVRRYSSRIDLPAEHFRMDQIKAEMKNGVLRVVVPKAKEEERKDVFHVNIE